MMRESDLGTAHQADPRDAAAGDEVRPRPSTAQLDEATPPSAPHHHRLAVLDGWRACSILLVLATHMLPLGPSRLRINSAAGVAGMSLFFTLSGFLIVTTLHRHQDTITFLIRRLCRIIPLAYTATVVLLLLQREDWSFYPPHFLFLINYDHAHLTELTAHFWSLCVEMHFYALTALLMAVFGFRGLLTLPLLGLLVSANKFRLGEPHSITTHTRVDEILVGASLALIWLDNLGAAGCFLKRWIGRISPWIWIGLFAISSWSFSGYFQYLQPYLAGAAVGSTLVASTSLNAVLSTRPLRYIAEISYALYVVHPATMYGWLGSGDKWVKYAKRPLCFALSFGLAHLSTFHFERHWIAVGKYYSNRILRRRSQAAPSLSKP